jgi:coproporphyrinogen III oxidase-like Fe-S oxidoreductase
MYPQRFRSHHDTKRKLRDHFVLLRDAEQYVRRLMSHKNPKRKTIYVHVPFCEKICSFCGMYRRLRQDKELYFKQLKAQIQSLAHLPYMASPVHSVYFGGGTPTALPAPMLGEIIELLRSIFNLVEGAEISVETTATELDDNMVQTLKSVGVNRLSIGVQTFNDEGRKLMNRLGSGDFVQERIQNALDQGIKNTNIDLIYTWPGQTPESLETDLDIMEELDIAGFSFYGLNLPKSSVFAHSLSQDHVFEVFDIDREKAMFDLIYHRMSRAGFELLELNKMVRPGRDEYQYIHIRNLGGDTIALGDGAGGSYSSYSYYNLYPLRPLAADLPVSAMGKIYAPRFLLLNEFDFAWQQAEVDLVKYSQLLELDLSEVLAELLGKYGEAGLITQTGSLVRLTHEGIYWGYNMINEIMTLLAERIIAHEN